MLALGWFRARRTDRQVVSGALTGLLITLVATAVLICLVTVIVMLALGLPSLGFPAD
jgi:hypothetical protein